MKGCPPTPDRGDAFGDARHPLLRKITLSGINATRPPRRPTFARQEVAMIETRVGLQAALNGDRTKAAHPAKPVSVEELARHAAACVAAGARAIHLTPVRRGMIAQVTSRPAAAQHLRDLARLRRVRDRIDREYAQPLHVEALARGVYMSAGHLSREFRLAYGESPY